VGDYSFGFNGIEMVSSEFQELATDFRFTNLKLGKWISMDPINHEGVSPYQMMDCNPIMMYDPSGADGEGDLKTGEITSTIYIKFDDNTKLSSDQKKAYLDAFKANIDQIWGSQTLANGTPISTKNVTVQEAPDGLTPQNLKRNENFIRAGNGQNADKNSMPGVSYIDDNELNNTGYMYLSSNATEAAHEFGHILGLSDRYFEGVMTQIVSYSGNTSTTSRLTMPIADIKDRGYNYLNNLMSIQGGTMLTESQLKIAFKRGRSEKRYVQMALLHSADVMQSQNYDGVSLKGHYYRNQIGYEGVKPTQYDSSLKFKFILNWHEQQVKNFISQNRYY
jgi:RHS repeat-associated protein